MFRNILIALTVLVVPSVGLAQLNVSNTFTANTPAVAAEVNQNFDEVEAAVNANTSAATAAQNTANNAQATATNTNSRRGIDFSVSDAVVPVGAAVVNVGSVTMTIPTVGFVSVDFSAYARIAHTNGTKTSVTCALKTSNTSPNSSTDRLPGSFRNQTAETAQPTAVYGESLVMSSVYSATGPGSVTFFAVCIKDSGVGNSEINNVALKAVYHERRL